MDCLVHNKIDNVGVVLRDIDCHETISVSCLEDGNSHMLTSSSDIPANFKIALKSIETGENVYEYGEVIGTSTSKISRGELVHVHNIKSLRL